MKQTKKKNIMKGGANTFTHIFANYTLQDLRMVFGNFLDYYMLNNVIKDKHNEVEIATAKTNFYLTVIEGLEFISAEDRRRAQYVLNRGSVKDSKRRNATSKAGRRKRRQYRRIRL